MRIKYSLGEWRQLRRVCIYTCYTAKGSVRTSGAVNAAGVHVSGLQLSINVEVMVFLLFPEGASQGK